VEVVASLSQGRTDAAQCGLFTYKSVPVIFEPPCIFSNTTVRNSTSYGYKLIYIPNAFVVVNMPYIEITTKFNLP